MAENTNVYVFIEYIGKAKNLYIKPIRHKMCIYRFGNNNTHSIKPVLRIDVEYLMALRDKEMNPIFRVV